MKLNEAAFRHAKSLIRSGKYVTDTDWSKAQPSTDELLEMIDERQEEKA